MFKFSSAKHQLAFLAIAVLVNIVSSDLGDLSELGILEETDVDVLSDKQPPCRYNCTEPYEPLCGSNGRTYGNICHLNTKNKCDKEHIFKRFDGTCRLQRCIPDPHRITCFCHFPRPTTCFSSFFPHRLVRCSNISRPVCGTNGITYQNACQLVLRTACFGYPVRVCHRGRCRRFADEDTEKVSIAHESAE